MARQRIIVGDVRTVLATLEDQSIIFGVYMPNLWYNERSGTGVASTDSASDPSSCCRQERANAKVYLIAWHSAAPLTRGACFVPSRKLPPNDEVIAMYRSGMSTGEIAERCNVRPVTVHSLLQRIGEPMRSATEAARIRSERGRANTPRYWLGKKQAADHVERRVAPIRGENHYLWKGGESRRPYRDVVTKDRCDRCGTTDRLSIHHVDFDHYNDEPENLRVLCASCHMSLHRQAYWDAIHAGQEPPKSNAPVGWKRKGGG